MIHVARREVLGIGAAAMAASGLSVSARATALTAEGFVVDTRFPSARRTASPLGAWRHAIDGDVTALWVDRLDQAWRRPGPALAGITGEDALFVLEHLAWDRQRRVVLREIVPQAGGPAPLVRWLIAAKGDA